MEKELGGVAEHIKDLGLGALAHALRHSLYAAMENPRWDDLSVLQAAHAAELLVKARIAEEHPLLIFEQLPKPGSGEAGLSLQALFERGRTYQWADLPSRLWATTGLRLSDENAWTEYGKLRNTIQHFASPNRDLSGAALQFVFGVVDPFIHDCWGLYAVDYNEDYDHYEHIFETLLKRKVRFLVSPGSVEWVQKALARVGVSQGDRAYFESEFKRAASER